MLDKNLNRRALLAGIGMTGAAVALAGCATTKNGSVTTITLNVAKITAYAQAGLQAITTVTDALAMFPTLAAYITPVKAIETVLKTELDAFTEAAGSSITVSYDDATIKTRVDSILADIQSLATQIATIIGKMALLSISSMTANTIQTTYDALTTIISVFRALLVSSTAMVIAPQHLAMSEAQALRVLAA